jgi:hypothetical protein
VSFSPRYTQSSDEVFLTASNQIVNDLHLATHDIAMPQAQAGLETCFGRARNHIIRTAASRKISLSFDQNFGLVIG